MDLRDISIFKNISEENLEFIKNQTKIEEITYPRGSHIFRVGDATGDMYYLVEGSITVYKIDPNGKRFIIKKFDQPAVFGEVYSYLKEPFDFSAQAEVDSKVLLIRDFRKIFNENTPKEFLISYINLLSHKCLSLSRNNQITSQSTLRQKIAKYLILNREDNKVKITVSREEWADSLATTRPSLSRELSNMADDGLIVFEDREIIINNINDLKNII